MGPTLTQTRRRERLPTSSQHERLNHCPWDMHCRWDKLHIYPSDSMVFEIPNLTSEFYENVISPDDLRDEITWCLRPKTAAALRKQHCTSKPIVRANLLPRCHKSYPTHCVLLMSDGQYVILTPVLLLRLTEKIPWLGSFKAQGLHTAFKAERFKGLLILYRW